jgi:NAD(P)-dependent dehydrogenase (short-subunit alcohol dehydrogenase family)
MGEAIAAEFAALGCSVVCVEHPTRLALCQEAAARLSELYKVKTIALAADATNAAEVEASFAAAAAAFVCLN